MASKMFKTQYDKHDRVIMKNGDAKIPIRKARKINGDLIIEDTKEIFDMDDWINSHKESVDIDILLKRFKAGDPDAIDKLTRQYGDYIDISEIPDNWNDAMDKVQQAKNMFYALPADIKEKFDNNYEKFVIETGSKEWMEKMGYEGTVNEVSAEDTPVVGDIKE